MAEEKIAILMDSGGDLPYELCQKEGIEFLPLHVIYPEKGKDIEVNLEETEEEEIEVL